MGDLYDRLRREAESEEANRWAVGWLAMIDEGGQVITPYIKESTSLDQNDDILKFNLDFSIREALGSPTITWLHNWQLDKIKPQ